MSQMPTPTDPATAPVWENYVVAQATQAALRLIPAHAVALGVVVDGYDITLVCKMMDETAQDRDDLADVADYLTDLVSQPARVQVLVQPSPEPALNPSDGVRWFWAARTDRG